MLQRAYGNTHTLRRLLVIAWKSNHPYWSVIKVYRHGLAQGNPRHNPRGFGTPRRRASPQASLRRGYPARTLPGRVSSRSAPCHPIVLTRMCPTRLSGRGSLDLQGSATGSRAGAPR
jgi:hypothetical protein